MRGTGAIGVTNVARRLSASACDPERRGEAVHRSRSSRPHGLTEWDRTKYFVLMLGRELPLEAPRHEFEKLI
jgi:hypothetical protein